MKICAGTYQTMGLNNRLRALLSVMRIRKRFGHPFCLYWPVTAEVSCRFGDLFEMPVEEVDSPQGDAFYFSWRLWVAEDELAENWARTYPSEDVKGRAIDLEFDRIPPHLREAYVEQILQLRPRAELVHRAESLMKDARGGIEGAGEGGVAVHVRDGADWHEWGRTTPLENFFTVMDRLPASTRFFVSAHVPATVQQIARRYPGRVLHQEGKDYAGTTVKRMQDALVDMLCLARGTQLIGTFGSTFTEMAWWMGGCHQPVTIVEGDRSQYRWF